MRFTRSLTCPSRSIRVARPILLAQLETAINGNPVRPHVADKGAEFCRHRLAELPPIGPCMREPLSFIRRVAQISRPVARRRFSHQRNRCRASVRSPWWACEHSQTPVHRDLRRAPSWRALGAGAGRRESPIKKKRRKRG